MTKKVLYWDGIIANKELAECHALTLQKILQGHYKEANLDLKKLPHHRIYSVRVNLSDRLLLTTVKKDNQSYLLLLGEVTNHDYHKSPFLKPAVLSAFLEKNAPSLAEEALIGEQDFQLYTASLFNEEQKEMLSQDHSHLIETEAFTYYNNNFIQFNDSQQRALQTTLPAVISGGAGCGKSCVAFSLLANGHGRRLYLAQSQELVNHMRQLWAEHPSAQLLKGEVVFKSYNDLVLELDPNHESYELVGEAQFMEWLDKYEKAYQRQTKTTTNKGLNALLLNFSEQSSRCYQEFRIISACNQEEYFNLGKNQCLFHEKGQKTWLFNAYIAYQKHQQGNKQLDPGFHNLKTQALYDLIVVDEAQDLSQGQLKHLLHLAINANIAFCIDSHQSLSDCHSKRPFLLTQLPQQIKKKMQCIELPGSYRCPITIIEFANHLLSLKFMLTGGLADKMEPSLINPMQDKRGSVEWIETLKDKEVEAFRKASQSSQLAVITLDQFKEKAKKLFNTPLVFTVDEIKGLEYDTIIAYQLFHEIGFEEASRTLAQMTSQKSNSPKTVNRPKNNAGDEKFAPLFNHLFTAFTRAMSRLVIVEPKTHERRILIEALKEGIPKQSSIDTQNETQPTHSWEEEANKLRQLGRDEQANAILREKLGRSENEIKALCPSNNKQLESKEITLKSNTQATRPKTPSRAQIKPILKSHPSVETQPSTPNQKELNYLKGLMDNLSDINLTHLCNSKRYEQLFFHTFIDKNNTLFFALFLDGERSRKLKAFFDTRPEMFAKAFAPAFICKPFGIQRHLLENTSILYWLAQLPSTQWVLEKIKDNPTLLKEFTVEALCRCPTELFGDGMLKNSTALYFLCSSFVGQEFLFQLFTHNPQLAKTISDESWMLKPNHSKNSALTEIKNTQLGEKVIKMLPESIQLLSKYMDILQDSDFNLLERLIKQFDETCLRELFEHEGFEFLMFYPIASKKFSVFRAILSNEDEAEIFINFLSNNEDLLCKITPQTLSREYRITSYGESNSPLYLLFATKGGYKLLTTFPSLLKGISGEVLCRQCPLKDREFESVSCLYHLGLLSNFDEGILLKYLVTESRESLKGITIEGLFGILATSLKEHMNTTAFITLCKHEEGIWFLHQLFHSNPNLLKGVNQEVLCRETNVVDFGEITALFCLAGFEDGQHFLFYLLNNKPSLAATISLESWLLKPSKSDRHALDMIIKGPYQSHILALLPEEIKEVAKNLQGFSAEHVGIYSSTFQTNFFSIRDEPDFEEELPNTARNSRPSNF